MKEKGSLKVWRMKSGLSKSEVAARAGVSLAIYSFWEKEPGEILICQAARLAEIFSCDLQSITFFRKNSKKNLEIIHSSKKESA